MLTASNRLRTAKAASKRLTEKCRQKNDIKAEEFTRNMVWADFYGVEYYYYIPTEARTSVVLYNRAVNRNELCFLASFHPVHHYSVHCFISQLFSSPSANPRPVYVVQKVLSGRCNSSHTPSEALTARSPLISPESSAF